MITYSEFRPTAFDRAGAFLHDERQEWLVSSVSQTRDSGLIDQSNFDTACKMIGSKASPEDYEVHRFGHWGPGWFEVIIVRPGSVAATIAQDIEDSLADYPLLDESDHSEREWQYACESWASMRVRDRVELIQECRDRFRTHGREHNPPAPYSPSIFAARRDEIPEDESGYIYERLTRGAN